MPLAFGGGIRNILHIDKLINNGADTVILNSICYQEYKIISKISKKYGSQSIIISTDIKYCEKDEEYKLYSNNGTKLEKVKINTIIINSIYIQK